MKRLLLAPLLITFSFLNMGFSGKPKLNTIYCRNNKELKSLSFEDKWANYPWIYDEKTGKLYDYDNSLNEISPLNEWRADDEIYTYKSILENNILIILESEKNQKYPDTLHLFFFKPMIKISKYVGVPKEQAEEASWPCEILDLPKGVKINY